MKGIGDIMGGKILEFLQMVENLQKNLKLSLEDALKAIDKTMEEYENAKRVIK